MSDGFYFKVLNLLKMFNNRPHHLAKFIIDNNILSEDTIRKLNNNEFLNKEIDFNFKPNIFFKNISEVEDYYDNIINNEKIDNDLKLESLKEKLDYFLSIEDYRKANEINKEIQKIENKK